MQLLTTLTDGSVTLRQMQMSDSSIIFEAVQESLADLKPWMSWAHEGYSEEENRKWLESQSKGWFEQLNLIRAEIVVAVGNTASLRVAEKAGARREGILRNRMVVREMVYDAVIYSLIPQDFGLEL